MRNQIGSILIGWAAGAISVGVLLWRDVAVLRSQVASLQDQLENVQELLRVLIEQ